MSQMDEAFGRNFFGDGMDQGTLPLDVYEAGDELIVEASVPGFRKEDIHIQLHQGVLSIVAQHPATAGENGYQNYRYYRRERPWGAWTRRVALPGIVHDAEVQADLKDGVLKLHIPVPEAAKPKQIEIKA
jgi:HSP20 family protein